MLGRQGAKLRGEVTAEAGKLEEIDTKLVALAREPKLRQQVEQAARDFNAEIGEAKRGLSVLEPKYKQAKLELEAERVFRREQRRSRGHGLGL